MPRCRSPPPRHAIRIAKAARMLRVSHLPPKAPEPDLDFPFHPNLTPLDHANHVLQSMCSILHFECVVSHGPRPHSGTGLSTKPMILNKLSVMVCLDSRLYHFGSANAHSSCNEEAATLGTLLSISRLLTGRFFPGNGAQLSFL